MGSTVQTFAHELALAMRTLRPALASPSAFEGLALRLGWNLDYIPPQIQALGTEFAQLDAAIAPFFEDDEPDATQIGALLEAVSHVFEAIDALSTATFDPALAAEAFGAEFPARLIELVVGEYLVVHHPTIAFVAKAFGVLSDAYVPATATRPAYVRHQLAWPDIQRVLSDPSLLLRNAYGWGTPDFDAHELLGTLAGLLASIKLQATLEEYPDAKAARIEQAGDVPGDPVRWSLDAPLFFDTGMSTGVRVLPLPAAGAHMPGLAVMPYAVGTFEEGFPLDDHLSFTVRSGFDLQGGVAIRLLPGEPIDVLTGFEHGSPTIVRGMLSGRIEYKDPTLRPWTILGAASGTRIEAVSVAGVGALRLDGSDADLSLELELLGGRIVIAAGEGDSFLRHILPADGVAAPFDLAVGLSTTRGMYFRGSSALTVTVPIHKTLGPLSVSSLTFSVGVAGNALPMSVGADLAVELGPIKVVAHGVGLVANVDIPGRGGNLGPLDVGVGFKLPDGIGLAIDGAGFSGGGMISRDPVTGHYAGIIDVGLQNKLALTGVGIVHSLDDGYSLFVAIGARFKAIQLGLGFTLNGVGGMIGVHRTARVDVIRAGLKDGTLEDLLFPSDPIANASHLIASFERVFPTQSGRFLCGPILRIGWGTPTLITADIGLLVELPAPIRVALVGVVRSFLPHADAPLLVLQASFLGTADISRGTLSFDASLFDSRLLTYPLVGDVAARFVLLPRPNYLLSVGGFHPAYTPPPLDLPPMRRLAINLLGGDNPRLRADVYLARTSNSFQFGASVELYAAVSKFNVYGFVGFDTLIQVFPTKLAADVRATLAVRIGDDPIMSVGVEFSLEGPRPWHAKGKAHFEICWFISFSVHFDRTWGEHGEDIAPLIDVLATLIEVLSEPSSWMTRLADNTHALTTLRDTNATVVDPAGTLVITQKRLPLDVTLDRFSSAKPRDEARFSITRVTSNGDVIDTESVTEEFARAEFFTLSDAEKLSRPSFEAYPSGVGITGAAGLVADHVVARDVEYEQIIIDRTSPGRPAGKLPLQADRFGQLVRGAAIGRSVLAKNLEFRPTSAAVAAIDESYVIVSASDLRPARSPRTSYAEALEELRSIEAANPALARTLQIVTGSELAA